MIRMHRLIVIAVTLAFTSVLAAPAAAQPSATIDVEPATVDAAGTQTFTITGTGWAIPSPYFVEPCAVPESNDVADIDTTTCDSGALAAATVDTAGNLKATITLDVPAAGIAIVAVNGNQTQTAGQIVTVVPAGPNPDDDLPDTGAESAALALLALALVAAGTLLVRGARRS
jgi:LPXTG-motif cell wall-anchored protein